MKISIPKENREGETRVAASPEVVKKFTAMGFEVTIESGAGLNSGFTDEIFKNAGAKIASDTKATLENADIVFKIQRLMTSNDEINEIVKHVDNILLKNCTHRIVDDVIDIDPDRSKSIQYCDKCYTTFH